MTGQDLLIEILSHLNTFLGFNDPTVTDAIDDGDLLEASKLLAQQNALAPSLAAFIRYIGILWDRNEDDFRNAPYVVAGSPHIIDFNANDLNKKNRSFAYSDADFGFFSSKFLFDSGVIKDFSLAEYSLLWKQIQEFCLRCYETGDRNKVEQLINYIRTLDVNKGFVINKRGGQFNDHRHYSYIYLSFLNNSNYIQLPVALKYSNSVLNNSLSIDDTKSYEQYFDIYDVFNEVNMSSDLLSRFLKLYHALEYLIYRVYLVELTNRVGQSKIFVREFIGASESMKKSEKEAFKRNFEKIFTADLPKIKADLAAVATPSAKGFLSTEKIVSGFTLNIEKVAELIYGIRCCVVHNKESEYHLTFSNHEDYSVIIPLIKETIKTFEFLVIQKIKDDFTAIKYPRRSMNLY